MVARGAFHPHPDEVPGFPDGQAARTVVLVGWTGGAQWPAFTGSAEHADGQPNPLDRWTRRLLGAAARHLGGVVLYPGDGPPFLPFQRWAMRTEGIDASPLGLLIHPVWGLWHAWRGALVLRDRLPLIESPTPPSPCETCPRPCLTTCPVTAFTQAAYNTQACATHLATPTSACPTTGCAARQACPVTPPIPYTPAQLRFHMQALAVGLRRATSLASLPPSSTGGAGGGLHPPQNIS